MLPDRLAEEKKNAFEGHFYDPTTGKTFNGSTTNTAYSNFKKHFLNAVQFMKDSDNANAYRSLGMTLHYLQDVGQPQHASNFTALSIPIGYHGKFEDFIDTKITTYFEEFHTISNHDFHSNDGKTYTYKFSSPGYLFNACANISYQFKDTVNKFDTSDWDDTGLITVQNAAAFSALTIYLFADYADMTLYK